jgi:hypothetical protein
MDDEKEDLGDSDQYGLDDHAEDCPKGKGQLEGFGFYPEADELSEHG